MAFEKIIWFLWFQGIDEAPFVVRECLRSWIKRNPTWRVVVLDAHNIGDFVDVGLPVDVCSRLKPAHHADVIRLHLLDDYGGVWVDATTYCAQPLDKWLHAVLTSGYFSFAKPSADRAMSNWFMASEKNHRIIRKMKTALIAYWSAKHKYEEVYGREFLVRLFGKFFNLNEKTTRVWFLPIIARRLNLTPYYVFHYLFNYLIQKDEEFNALWEKTDKISADLPHTILHFGMLKKPDDIIKKHINENISPIYKLTYKINVPADDKNAAINYLLTR